MNQICVLYYLKINRYLVFPEQLLVGMVFKFLIVLGLNVLTSMDT